MSATRALQKALKGKLDAAALGIGVYDGAPATATFPYVEFGPDSSFPDDADCIDMREITLQIDVWGDSQAKLHPTRAMVDRIYDALHEAELSLDEPYACNTCRVVLTRTFPDPDGIRAHGVVQVTALVQDTSS